MKIKKTLTAILILLLTISIPLTAAAHSGRTDGNGGHRDNKNKSGLGSYHYHCGGYPAHLHTNGVCPYSGGGSTSTKTYSAPKEVYSTKINAVNVPNTINAGENVQLKGEVYPTNAQDKTIEWKSNAPEIVTVSSSGNLHAVGVGTATVTATTSRGTSTDFTITVTEVFAESITIETKPTDILLNENKTLSVAFTPAATTNKTIVWSSSNDKIISVNNDGKITAKALGTATITAAHGELTDSFAVKVLPIEAESINIIFPNDEKDDETDEHYRLAKGKQINLEAVVLPENTTDKTVTWSVDDESIAEIDEHGTITANGTGTVIVKAAAKNGINEEIEIEVYSYTAAAAAGGTGVAVIAGGTYYFVRKRRI
ncbi:MAG: Ig domain-containing protein [Firmicutes bacterium]|nr:Ig domain-containing protein [Bacillota bacterium]